MKKTIFTDKTVYWVVVASLSLMMLWNIFVLLFYSNLMALIPVAVILVLLWLTMTSHQYAKIGLMVWAGLFITGASLQFIGNLMQDVAGGDSGTGIIDYVVLLLEITVGVALFAFIKSTVQVEEVK